ncbi:MAG: 16S rRNA (cytidine(1402)-2'-O)-methyltransferase [Alkalispirochaeta sp.]
MGRLYIVATPIGNLGDMTYRAVEVLRGCRQIACEDTRQSRKLVQHYGISVPLIPCHGHNEERCIPRILEYLEEDADIAYISDAGTPGVSDPGSRLVRAVREAGHTVSPIPGASAVGALVSVSGVAGRGWWFEGFLPPKGTKRLNRLEELARQGDPFIVYESPHRIGKFFDELAVVAPGYSVVIGREMTKIYEQIVSCTVEEAGEMVQSGQIPGKGEFAILVWTGKKR